MALCGCGGGVSQNTGVSSKEKRTVNPPSHVQITRVGTKLQEICTNEKRELQFLYFFFNRQTNIIIINGYRTVLQ